jgi:hypothetical protein
VLPYLHHPSQAILSGTNARPNDHDRDELSSMSSLLFIDRLTPQQALALVKHFQGRPLRLDGLSLLDADIAGVLAGHNAALSFPKLETADLDVLQELSRHRYRLELGGLRAVPHKAFGILARHHGGLNLNGLTTITRAQLKTLLRGSGPYWLDGVTDVTDDTTQEPSDDGLPSDFVFRAPRSNSHSSDIPPRGQGDRKPWDLSPGSTDRIPPLVRDRVALPPSDLPSAFGPNALRLRAESPKGSGGVSLAGLKEIPLPVARIVAATEHDVILSGVKTLSPEVAAAFERHAGRLLLDGIPLLDDAAADSLAKHPGCLSLLGMKSFTSVSLARKLASDSRAFDTTVERPQQGIHSTSHVGYGSGFAGLAVGPALETLSPEIASILSSGKLDLSNIHTLEPDVATELARHDGPLLLNGLTSLSCDSARTLAPHTGAISLDGLSVVSDELANCLVEFASPVQLGGLETASDEALAVLLAQDSIVVPTRLRPVEQKESEITWESTAWESTAWEEQNGDEKELAALRTAWAIAATAVAIAAIVLAVMTYMHHRPESHHQAINTPPVSTGSCPKCDGSGVEWLPLPAGRGTVRSKCSCCSPSSRS